MVIQRQGPSEGDNQSRLPRPVRYATRRLQVTYLADPVTAVEARVGTLKS